MTRSLRRAPAVVALLLPVVAFLVIGRTVEIKKALDQIAEPDQVVSRSLIHLQPRRFGLSGGGSAGAGLSRFVMVTKLTQSDPCCPPLPSAQHSSDPRTTCSWQALAVSDTMPQHVHHHPDSGSSACSRALLSAPRIIG